MCVQQSMGAKIGIQNSNTTISGKTDIRGVWNDWKQTGKVNGEIVVLVAAQGGVPLKHTGEIRRADVLYKRITGVSKSNLSFYLG